MFKKPPSPVPETQREPEPLPMTRPTCSCGGRYFTSGGASVSPCCDGRSSWLEPQGGVLSCLQCGKRWYTTPEGLREPHADAMPPTWAAMDMQARAVRQRLEQAEGRTHNPKRPLDREFRRPPRVPS